jgi:hypothetical protein
MLRLALSRAAPRAAHCGGRATWEALAAAATMHGLLFAAFELWHVRRILGGARECVSTLGPAGWLAENLPLDLQFAWAWDWSLPLQVHKRECTARVSRSLRLFPPRPPVAAVCWTSTCVCALPACPSAMCCHCVVFLMSGCPGVPLAAAASAYCSLPFCFDARALRLEFLCARALQHVLELDPESHFFAATLLLAALDTSPVLAPAQLAAWTWPVWQQQGHVVSVSAPAPLVGASCV